MQFNNIWFDTIKFQLVKFHINEMMAIAELKIQ